MPDILTKLQNDPNVIKILTKSQAISLINDGYARHATIQPVPTGDNVAINLTVRGKSYKPTGSSAANGKQVDKPTDPE